MRGYKGPDYKALSEDTVLHQVGVNFFLSVALFLLSLEFLSHLLMFLTLLCIRLWLCGVERGHNIF